jgi:nucleoside-diphosphate-sugar epimerase
LANKVIEKIGRKVKIVVTPERQRPVTSEVKRLISDNHLAREILGWSPKVALDQGLDRTIEWISRNLSYFQADKYQF